MANSYSLILIREGEKISPSYEGHKREVVDGKANGTLREFGPRNALEVTVRQEIERNMTTNPQINRAQVKFWED